MKIAQSSAPCPCDTIYHVTAGNTVPGIFIPPQPPYPFGQWYISLELHMTQIRQDRPIHTAVLHHIARNAKLILCCGHPLLYMHDELGVFVEHVDDCEVLRPRERHGRSVYDSCRHSAECSRKEVSVLSWNISQLAEQLEIAQTLQAAALAARAKVRKRFARDDVAALVLQAGVRRFLGRRHLVRTLTSSSATKKEDYGIAIAFGTTPHDRPRGDPSWNVPSKSEDDIPKDGEADTLPRTNLCHSGSSDRRRSGTVLQPREEGGWWTLAESESIDEIKNGESKHVMDGHF